MVWDEISTTTNEIFQENYVVIARKETKNKLSIPSVWGTIKENRHFQIISTTLKLLVIEHADVPFM